MDSKRSSQASQIMFCLHEKCKNETRILQKMDDMMNHTGANHKVVNMANLQDYVRDKFQSSSMTKMEGTIQKEETTKEEVAKIIEEIKERLDEFLESETKKLPSLYELSQNVKMVLGGKDVNDSSLKNIVNFNPEAIPRYANVLDMFSKKMSDIQQVINNILKDSTNYREEVVALQIMRNKWVWSDQLKSSHYRIEKYVTEPTPFMGWSFILVNPAVTQRALHEIELQIEEVFNEKVLKAANDVRTFNFAIGMTHLKQRISKGYDQQDLSTLGHGFYLLRSDGWVCHNSNKEVNWKKDLAFIPSEKSPIVMKWNPQDHILSISQRSRDDKSDKQQRYEFKVDKLLPQDNLHFCVHLKSARCKILD